VIISSFNKLKYVNNNYRTEIAVSKIYSSLRKGFAKSYSYVFSIFKQDRKSYEI